MAFVVRTPSYGYTPRSAVPMSSTPDNNSPWWYALAGVGLTFFGAVLKTFSDLVGRRDSRDQQWRNDLLTDQRELRAWCGRQQEELGDYHTRVQNLEKNVKGEQELRHEIKNRLTAEQLSHELVKQDLKTSEEKRAELAAKLESVTAANGKLEIQIHDLTERLARCAEGKGGDC
jgi:chromosome segregation ATPase